MRHPQKNRHYNFPWILAVASLLLSFYVFSNIPVLEGHINFQQLHQQQRQISSHHHSNSTDHKQSVIPIGSVQKKKCALLLFGLPRAFRTIVLPSLAQNVLRVNLAKYDCDVYAHYYQVDHEAPGRQHRGGQIEKDAVQLLRQAVADTKLGTGSASVHIIAETDEQFWLQRNVTVQKYRTTIDRYHTGKYLYFPWKDAGYLYPLSLDNIVKQWHSINAVFEKMESVCRECYERIAMLRLDVFYATPIDIYQLDTTTQDINNQYAVLPAFGKFPVNDRIVYGPYKAVKVWATERFQRVEEHVLTYEPGYGMHSERFLNHSILPAMERTGVQLRENPGICFMRVRADESIWAWDCLPSMSIDKKKSLIEGIIGRNCTQEQLGPGVIPVICSE